MTSKVTALNKITKYTKKTLAVILAGVFLFTNTLSWAKEEGLFSAGTENKALSSGPADNNKLAPLSRLNGEEFKISLTVAAICKHIEYDGNLDDKSYLNDVLARLDAGKNPYIIVLPYEIIIDIPSEGLAVRYFDPTKANVITPYSDISKLSTKVIGLRLNRQIIHRIKSISQPKALFGSERITELRVLLPALNKFQFPHGEDFSKPEDRKPLTLKEVIESQPSKDYRIPIFDLSQYTERVVGIQRKIVFADFRDGAMSLIDVIRTYYRDMEEDLLEYMKTHNPKQTKMHMMDLLWEREGAISRYVPWTLLLHAEQEWKIINKLVEGDSDFKDAAGNPLFDSNEVLRLYNQYFGEEFKSLKNNKTALNFIAHLLLIHDLGKYSIGETGHEKRSEAILSEVFENDYFGFSEAEKTLLKRIIGIHAQIEMVGQEGYQKKFEDIINEAFQYDGIFNEEDILDILRIWIMFRIAECVQGRDFGFADEGYFQRIQKVYTTAKQIISETYAKKIGSNVALTSVANFSLQPLTKEFANKHVDRLLELQNTIPGVHWTPDQLLEDEWPAFGLFKRKVFPAKWEYSIVVVDNNGNPIGLLLAYERPPDDEMRKVEKGSLYIHGFAVDPEWQGRGIGKTMMHRLAENLLHNGFKRIDADSDLLITLRFDRKSLYLQEVYKKLGFKIVDTIEGLNAHNDYICMAPAIDVFNKTFTSTGLSSIMTPEVDILLDVNIRWAQFSGTDRFEYKKCPVCDADGVAVRRVIINGRTFYIYYCSHDDWKWLNPTLPDTFLEQLYSGEYWHIPQELMIDMHGRKYPLVGFENYNSPERTEQNKMVAGLRMADIQNIARKGLPEKPQKSFLEIGFASGDLILEADKLGWEAWGIDISQDAVEAFRRKNEKLKDHVRQGSCENIDLGGTRFDVIAAYNLVEHLHDIPPFLENAHALLNDDGMLVIDLPIVPNSLPMYKSYIEHLHHPSLKGICIMLQKAGFDIAEIYCPHMTDWPMTNLEIFAKKSNKREASTDVIEISFREKSHRDMYERILGEPRVVLSPADEYAETRRDRHIHLEGAISTKAIRQIAREIAPLMTDGEKSGFWELMAYHDPRGRRVQRYINMTPEKMEALVCDWDNRDLEAKNLSRYAQWNPDVIHPDMKKKYPGLGLYLQTSYSMGSVLFDTDNNKVLKKVCEIALLDIAEQALKEKLTVVDLRIKLNKPNEVNVELCRALITAAKRAEENIRKDGGELKINLVIPFSRDIMGAASKAGFAKTEDFIDDYYVTPLGGLTKDELSRFTAIDIVGGRDQKTDKVENIQFINYFLDNLAKKRQEKGIKGELEVYAHLGEDYGNPKEELLYIKGALENLRRIDYIVHGTVFKHAKDDTETRGIAEEACRLMIERDVKVLASISSNVQTEVIKSPEEYPLQFFAEQGIEVLPTTDNPRVSRTSFHQEKELLDAINGAQLVRSKIDSLDNISPDRNDLYGNKAVNLRRMIQLGLPVPPGFVIPTDMLKNDNIPSIETLREQVMALEEKTGKKFGDKDNPLIFSVRSSPPYSMPGLLSTELKIKTEDELLAAIRTVKTSWESEEAKRYRELHNISHDSGTAIIVQAMVFGYLNDKSGAGVIFTQDPVTGNDEIAGRFAPKADGKDVVSRSRVRIRPVDNYFAGDFPQAYAQFVEYKSLLEKEFKYPQEVEFVIENGKLWVLQTRDAVLSPRAQTHAALSLRRRGVIDQFEMLRLLEDARKKIMYKLAEADDLFKFLNVIASGNYWNKSSPGVACGPIALSIDKAKEYFMSGRPAILVALEETDEIKSAILSGMVAGVITRYGHEALHEAVLARVQGIPMIDGDISFHVLKTNKEYEEMIAKNNADNFGFSGSQQQTVNGVSFVRFAVSPEIQGNNIVVWDRLIPEGTEIVMDATPHQQLVYLKENAPEIEEDGIIDIEGLDFDYGQEEKEIKAQYEVYDYDALVLLHAGMLRNVYADKKITGESLRLNLAAHTIHNLILEKGRQIGKTPKEIDNNISETFRFSGGAIRIKPGAKTVKILGIRVIYVSESDVVINFLPPGYNADKYEQREEAIRFQKAFIEKLYASDLVKQQDIEVIEYSEYDPMPHGHGSSPVAVDWDYELGVCIKFDTGSKLDKMKYVNKILSELATYGDDAEKSKGSASAANMPSHNIPSIFVDGDDIAILGKAGRMMREETIDMRPCNNKGNPGQLLKLNTEHLIVIGDLHTELEGLDAIMDRISREIPEEEITSGRTQVILTGDFMQTMNENDFDSFKKSSEQSGVGFRYRDYEQYKKDVDGRTYKLMLKIAQLKIKYGNGFHILPGNAELGFMYKRAFENMQKLFDEQKELFEKVKEFVNSMPLFAIANISDKKYLISHGGVIENGLTENKLINYVRHGVAAFSNVEEYGQNRKRANDELIARKSYYAALQKSNDRELKITEVSKDLGIIGQIFGHIHLFGEKSKTELPELGINLADINGRKINYGTSCGDAVHVINSLLFGNGYTYLEVSKSGITPNSAEGLSVTLGYNDKTITKNQNEHIDRNKSLFKDMLGENKRDVLLRIPIEAIESIGVDNIKDVLATFQGAPNGYIELYYMSGMGEVNESIYEKYGLHKKLLPKDFKRTRENTVTLFPAFKGEEIDQSTIASRLGNLNITPENTILSPIGLQHDPAGLIRATILGLKIMDIARQAKEGKEIDKDAVHIDILNQLRDVLDPSDFKNFDLTPEDIIALATGNINSIIIALKKLIRLLPIAPIDAEELRQIYEHVKMVITAA